MPKSHDRPPPDCDDTRGADIGGDVPPKEAVEACCPRHGGQPRHPCHNITTLFRRNNISLPQPLGVCEMRGMSADLRGGGPRLVLLLALGAGAVDAVVIAGFQVLTAAQTGNTPSRRDVFHRGIVQGRRTCTRHGFCSPRAERSRRKFCSHRQPPSFPRARAG